MLKSTTYLSFLLASLSPLLSSCETQSKTDGCTYGQDCSHYPRDFVVGQTASGDTSVFGISWASDGLFSTGDKVEIYTSLSDSKRDGFKDLWGPSAITYQAHPTEANSGFYYVTGALENSLVVLQNDFFDVYGCTTSGSCDGNEHADAYVQALADSGSQIFRREDFGHDFEVPVQTLLSHPSDVVTWSQNGNIIVFVASRDGGQVSIFQHALDADDASGQVSLRYIDEIETEGPARLLILDADPDDNQMQLVVHGTSEVRSCPDKSKLAANAIPLDELREDFLSIYTITDGLADGLEVIKSTEQRSGSCYGSDNCVTNEALRGTWGMVADGDETLLLSNRCNNEVLEFTVAVTEVASDTTVAMENMQTFSFKPGGEDAQAALFDKCEVKPKNLGFKGLAVSSDYLYVASWETGYILEWPRDGSAMDTPRALCAVDAARCQLNKCTDVNPNWYLRNDSNAHFYQDGSNQQETMRPFPYQLQITNDTLYMTLDRNSELATCTLEGPEKDGDTDSDATERETDDATTTVVAPNLGLESALGVQECVTNAWR